MDLGYSFKLPQERGSASNLDSPSPRETQDSLLAAHQLDAERGCSLSRSELCGEIPNGWPRRIFLGDQQEASGGAKCKVLLPVPMDSKL